MLKSLLSLMLFACLGVAMSPAQVAAAEPQVKLGPAMTLKTDGNYFALRGDKIVFWESGMLGSKISGQIVIEDLKGNIEKTLITVDKDHMTTVTGETIKYTVDGWRGHANEIRLLMATADEDKVYFLVGHSPHYLPHGIVPPRYEPDHLYSIDMATGALKEIDKIEGGFLNKEGYEESELVVSGHTLYVVLPFQERIVKYDLSAKEPKQSDFWKKSTSLKQLPKQFAVKGDIGVAMLDGFISGVEPTPVSVLAIIDMKTGKTLRSFELENFVDPRDVRVFDENHVLLAHNPALSMIDITTGETTEVIDNYVTHFELDDKSGTITYRIPIGEGLTRRTIKLVK